MVVAQLSEQSISIPEDPGSNPAIGHFLWPFFKKWANSGLFLFMFGLFKQTSIYLQQINVKKCRFDPVYGARIQTHDLSIKSHLP